MQLHQAEAGMISFFNIATKKKKAGLLPQEGATDFVEEENDQDIINDVAQVVSVLEDKNRKPCGSNRDRDVRKEQWIEFCNQKAKRNFQTKCASIVLHLISCLIPYGMGWS